VPVASQNGVSAADVTSGSTGSSSSSAGRLGGVDLSAGGTRGCSQTWGRHAQLLAIDKQQDGLQELPTRQQHEQQLGVSSNSGWLVDAGYVALGSHCPLFGRKFAAAVVNQTLAMALSCSGLGLGSWCRSGTVVLWV
jgi:hypothetical protein